MRSSSVSNTTIALTTAILLAASGSAGAKMYKWVDEDGVTQYTQTPPPKGDYKPVKPPPPPPSSAAQSKKDLDKRGEEFEKRREEKAEADKKAAKDAKIEQRNKSNCATARANLEKLKTGRRLRSKEKDGSIKYVTEDDRTARIEKAQEQIKKFCK